MKSRQVLKQADYELYLISVFLPAAQREKAWPLLALVAELYAIPQKVREPLAGAMRLAWWRERLQEIYAGKPPRNHPILQELAPLIIQYELPYAQWERLLNALGEVIEMQQPPSTEYAAMLGRELVLSWLQMITTLEEAKGKEEGEEHLEAIATLYGMLRLAAFPQAKLMQAIPDEMVAHMNALYEKKPTKKEINRHNHKMFVLINVLCELRFVGNKPSKINGIDVSRAAKTPASTLQVTLRVLLTK